MTIEDARRANRGYNGRHFVKFLPPRFTHLYIHFSVDGSDNTITPDRPRTLGGGGSNELGTRLKKVARQIIKGCLDIRWKEGVV